ncbi:MAG: bifunctional UDP-N-acetylglucosamine diphosphorylase/glucosamine-1-phosphate N-acetyltransferase GlmU [Acetobacteraceae bacterium]|nr:bifunctional UDP-N-acetylglucosamine diphosphorylase/glucosamine-1-phosphate N-acetyltransferase GlmU [Acetobacteraceae bacterium]
MGTRMKSKMPKALHPLAGRPILRHLLDSCEAVFERIVVVLGPGMEALKAAAAPHPVIVQTERLGTAHATLQATGHFSDGDVAILYADTPLIRPETISALLARRQAGDAGLALLAMRPPDPARYGRVLQQDGFVSRIVEWMDATEAERAERLCNAGVLCGPGRDMARWLRDVRNDNAKSEYYLTDVVGLARSEGLRVAVIEAPHDELRGINSRAELAEAELVLQARLRRAAMEAGVTLTDPASVFLCSDTELAPDVTIAPNVVFGPGVVVEEGAEIRAFSHLEGCRVGPGAVVGPFARLRPGTILGPSCHVGNFVELKATTLGPRAKANHLTYLGDAEIGAETNIGAGTITCNYDGFAKHRTVIGARAFVGSDVTLVAPVSVDDCAFVGAGSTITDNVAADAMAIARGRQVEKPGRAARFRADQERK